MRIVNNLLTRKSNRRILKELNARVNNIEAIVSCILRLQTGIEWARNGHNERMIVFDPKDAPMDHYKRYEFAVELVSGSVLDAACGCGYGTSMLGEKAKRVVGIDINAPAIEFARKIFGRDGVSFLCQDAQTLEIGDGFDWAVSFETIEHIPDTAAFVKRLAGMLVKDGRLVCSVPNEATIPYVKGANPFHVRHYTEAELAALLEECGFSVEYMRHQYLDAKFAVENRRKSEEGEMIVCVARKR